MANKLSLVMLRGIVLDLMRNNALIYVSPQLVKLTLGLYTKAFKL